MPHPVDIHVGKRIKEIRTVRGLTQSNVADYLGISFQQLQKYETGANRVSASRMFELSKLLDITPAFFFEGLEGQNYDTMPPMDMETARIAAALSRIKNKKLKNRINTLISEIVRSSSSSDEATSAA
ncbi:MAG: transcriptional regulator [Marinosulfonomonas sp.]|nr:MAG: transcriptional regulator [Marinosulfonomonas sp.]